MISDTRIIKIFDKTDHFTKEYDIVITKKQYF